MPTYVYECAKCGEEMEEWQSFSEEPLKKHPGCGGKLAKVLQPVGIVFKGSGFHRTDSRSAAKRSHSDGSSDCKESKDSSDVVGEVREVRRRPTRSPTSSSSSSSDNGKKSSDSKSTSDSKKSSSTSTSK